MDFKDFYQYRQLAELCFKHNVDVASFYNEVIGAQGALSPDILQGAEKLVNGIKAAVQSGVTQGQQVAQQQRPTGPVAPAAPVNQAMNRPGVSGVTSPTQQPIAAPAANNVQNNQSIQQLTTQLQKLGQMLPQMKGILGR